MLRIEFWNRRAARRGVALILLLFLTATFAWSTAGRRDRQDRRSGDEGPPGNMAVIDARFYEIATQGAQRRLLMRILVENQSPVDRNAGFRLEITKNRRRGSLGACQGEALPRGQVALCEVWLPTKGIEEGDTLTVTLARDFAGFAGWDNDPSDDRRSAELKTIPDGGAVLRIAKWDVRPRVMAGMGEAQFQFTVEGAHLVWLLPSGPDAKPRLLAGHPADGILTGKGRIRIRQSGPVTLVSRNSLGAFVYETIPVQNTYSRPEAHQWLRAPSQEVDGVATAVIFEPGVYEDDADEAVLQALNTYLASKDWAAEIQRMQRPGEEERPRPASVLNPEATKRRR